MTRKNNSYFIVNLIFVIIIGIALSYSYFFYPSNHPIPCFYKQYTGQNCPSCGFSRAFSSFMHLKFDEGITYNALALNCFLFFVFQFFLRFVLILINLFTKWNISTKIIFVELTVTIVSFCILFFPLLFY